MVARDELVAAIAERYSRADRTERSRILDEFTAVTGFHRKHAMRLFRAGRPNRRSGPRPGRRVYDDAVREALIVIWEASDRICGKRLRPLVPVLVEAMERHGHLQLAPEVRISLLAMSPATIDRALRDVRRQAGRSTRRKAPLRWRSGVACRCARSTAGTTYRKNDQAWVEQKNGSVVRRTVGYRRFEGLEAAAVLARLYAVLRLFVNFFQPSFKLEAKSRDGAKVTKRYHPPATPCQRLMADARTSEAVRRRLETLCATLDPVRLLQEIRAAQQQLVGLADAPVHSEATPPTVPTLEQFLSGLRTAWKGGEVRPTSVPKPKPKRLRRRPDPFLAVTIMLREWFEAEPWRTSRELFERLQVEYPGVYPDGQLRTCQRRLKEWRREAALRLVFGTATVDAIGVDSKKGCLAAA